MGRRPRHLLTTNQIQQRQQRSHERHDLARHGTRWLEMGLYGKRSLKQQTRPMTPPPLLRKSNQQHANKQRARLQTTTKRKTTPKTTTKKTTTKRYSSSSNHNKHTRSKKSCKESALSENPPPPITLHFMPQVRRRWVTMTVTMTHSEKSHIRRMQAWPYRQECRGHDPTKKNLFC